MPFFPEGRILRGIRLFLFCAVLAGASTASARAGEPTTVEGRVNRNAYPLARYAGKFEALPKDIDAELRSRIGQALAPIRLAPASWFRAAMGAAPSAADRRKILGSYAETEIWKCIGPNCASCPGNENLGCVLANTVAGGVGVVAVIHPCVYGDGKCPRGSPTDLGVWIEKFVLGVAYYKAGLPKNMTAFKKAQKASSDWLASTSRSVNQLLGACPGPYPASGLKFLVDVEAATLPNPAIARCGRKYLEELRELPKACKPLAGALRGDWTAYQKKFLRGTADVLRCDDYCLKMLCRPKGAGTVFTLVSGKPTLLLGDGACEGETPKIRGKFLRDAVPRMMRTKLEEASCLPALESEGGGSTSGSDDSTSSRSDGPEVQLVE